MTEREFHVSSNGDRWTLVQFVGDIDPRVEHRANAASGGAVTSFSLASFLAATNQAPEHEALRAMLEETRLKVFGPGLQ